ncbi:MAG: protein-S-isoprenylcysteine O-methyltransferase Ste14 [Planctomycetaceae bacterium]|jgi:protein-S-isoprenylcysteine O-methyltransferase Ste14
MQALENKIPPPIIMAVFLCVMWSVSFIGLTIELSAFTRGVIAILLLVSGVFFVAGGILTFKQAATTVNPLKPETASSLVTSGIYQITRNPMYVGLTLFLLAWSAYLCSVVAFCCVPVFVFYIHRFQITPEERALKEIFGSEFENYTSKVRRWI